MVLFLVSFEAASALVRQDLSVTSRVVQWSSGLLADHGLVATAVKYLSLVDGRKMIQRLLLMIVPVELRARNVRQLSVATVDTALCCVRSAVANHIDFDCSAAPFSSTPHRHATFTGLLLNAEVLLRAWTSLSQLLSSVHDHVTTIKRRTILAGRYTVLAFIPLLLELTIF